MQGDELLFEAAPFELEEGEVWRRRPGPPRPRLPLRPRRWRRPLVRPWFPAPATAGECETVLVLEGFAAGQSGLAAHHGPMLQRLVSYLSRTGQRPPAVEVEGRSAQGRPDRRAEAAARFLRTRVKGVTVTALSSRCQGPERVEIRFCFPGVDQEP